MRNSPSLRPAEAPQVLQTSTSCVVSLSDLCSLCSLYNIMSVYRSLYTGKNMRKAFVGLRGRHGASSWKLAHWKFPANICRLGCIVGNVGARHWEGRRIWLLWCFRKNVPGPIRLCCKIIKNFRCLVSIQAYLLWPLSTITMFYGSTSVSFDECFVVIAGCFQWTGRSECTQMAFLTCSTPGMLVRSCRPRTSSLTPTS